MRRSVRVDGDGPLTNFHALEERTGGAFACKARSCPDQLGAGAIAQYPKLAGLGAWA